MGLEKRTIEKHIVMCVHEENRLRGWALEGGEG
jgi:hypothetical protein